MVDAEIVALRAKLATRPRSEDYKQRRKDMDARGLQYGLAHDVSVEPVSANGVRAEWTSTPQAERDSALLYLHGGGFVIGSLDSHRHLVSEAGRAAKAWALALDYRLSPEHPFPAAVERLRLGLSFPVVERIQTRTYCDRRRQRRRGARRFGDGCDPRRGTAPARLRLVHLTMGRPGGDR